MRFIDLFAGVGGFRYGLERAYREQKSTQESISPKRNSSIIIGKQSGWWEKPDCVYSNEWDKYAASVYRYHYGECDQRDIRAVKSVPDHDLLCGGFPCQSFSIAGKRGGFNDTRGTLFFEIARILKQKQPRLCLLENVKGLLSHDSGRTFKTILATLTELGYDVQWQVLNSKNFGVPQNRERVFIIGNLRGQPRPKVFPITGNSQEAIFGPITGAIGRARSSGSSYVKEIRTDKPDSQQKRDKPDNTNAIRRVTYTNDMRIRRLTPIECERLQSFPDNWTQYGEGNVLISDTQRYKMMGNAVTTNVIRVIGEKLLLN